MIGDKKTAYLFIQVLALALTLAFATVSFSWLVSKDAVVGMEYSIAKIDSSVTVYTANDDNRNGIPNKLENPISADYYLEQYSFEKHGGEVYAMSDDSLLNKLPDVTFNDAFPTAIHTVKYALINRSTVENHLAFLFDETSLDETMRRGLSVMSARLGQVSSESYDSAGNVELGRKVYFYDYITGSSLSEMQLIDASEGSTYINGFLGNNYDNRLDFWLQLEIETYEDLLANVEGFSLTRAEYDSIAGSNIELPALYIYFEIVYEGEN